MPKDVWRGNHVSGLIDGKVIVSGGMDNHDLVREDTNIFDLKTESWSAGPPMEEKIMEASGR